MKLFLIFTSFLWAFSLDAKEVCKFSKVKKEKLLKANHVMVYRNMYEWASNLPTYLKGFSEKKIKNLFKIDEEIKKRRELISRGVIVYFDDFDKGTINESNCIQYKYYNEVLEELINNSSIYKEFTNKKPEVSMDNITQLIWALSFTKSNRLKKKIKDFIIKNKFTLEKQRQVLYKLMFDEDLQMLDYFINEKIEHNYNLSEQNNVMTWALLLGSYDVFKKLENLYKGKINYKKLSSIFFKGHMQFTMHPAFGEDQYKKIISYMIEKDIKESKRSLTEHCVKNGLKYCVETLHEKSILKLKVFKENEWSSFHLRRYRKILRKIRGRLKINFKDPHEEYFLFDDVSQKKKIVKELGLKKVKNMVIWNHSVLLYKELFEKFTVIEKERFEKRIISSCDLDAVKEYDKLFKIKNQKFNLVDSLRPGYIWTHIKYECFKVFRYLSKYQNVISTRKDIDYVIKSHIFSNITKLPLKFNRDNLQKLRQVYFTENHDADGSFLGFNGASLPTALHFLALNKKLGFEDQAIDETGDYGIQYELNATYPLCGRWKKGRLYKDKNDVYSYKEFLNCNNVYSTLDGSNVPTFKILKKEGFWLKVKVKRNTYQRSLREGEIGWLHRNELFPVTAFKVNSKYYIAVKGIVPERINVINNEILSIVGKSFCYIRKAMVWDKNKKIRKGKDFRIHIIDKKISIDKIELFNFTPKINERMYCGT